MRKQVYIIRFISLFMAALFAVNQLPVSVENSYGLGIPPLTSPLSTTQEKMDAVKAFLMHRIVLLERQGINPRNVELSLGHFPAQSLYDTTEDVNKSKRVQAEEIVPKGNGKYTLVCSVNGEKFLADLDVSGETPGIKINNPGTDDRRPFPAPRIPKLDEQTLAEARHITTNHHGAPDESRVAAVSRGLLSLFRENFNAGNFNHIPNVAAFFQTVVGVSIEDLHIKDWPRDHQLVGAMIRGICEKYPDQTADLALVCNAIGHVFYKYRDDIAYAVTANRKSEFFYGLAHALAPENVDYYVDWTFALKHNGQIRESIEESEKAIALARRQGQEEKVLKLMITLAGVPHDEARREVSDMEIHPHSVTVDRIAGVRRLISEVFNTLLSDCSRFSRALSYRGLAHCTEGRLNVIDHEHKVRNDMDSENIDRFVWYNINHMGQGMRHLKSAYLKAVGRSTPLGGEINHTGRMLRDGLEDTVSVLEYCWSMIAAHNVSFGDRKKRADLREILERVQTAHQDVRFRDDRAEAYGVRDIDQIANDVRDITRTLKKWLDLQDDVEAGFENALKKVLAEGSCLSLDDLNGQLDQAKRDLANNLSGRYAVFAGTPLTMPLFNASIDALFDHSKSNMDVVDLDLEILFAYGDLEAQDRTLSGIRACVIGSAPDDDSRRRFNTRLKKLTGMFGLRLAADTAETAELELEGVSYYETKRLESLADRRNRHEILAEITRPEPAARIYLIHAFKNIPGVDNDPAMMNALDRMLRNDPSCRVRWQAAATLVDLGRDDLTGTRDLYKALVEGTLGAMTLENGQKQTLIPLLLKAVVDPEPEPCIRETAARELAVIGDKRSSEPVLQDALNTETDLRVLRAVADALGRFVPVRRDDFKASYTAGRPGNFAGRIEKVRAVFPVLATWFELLRISDDRHSDIQSRIDLLGESIDNYRRNANAAMTAPGRPRNAHHTFSGEYYFIERALSSLEGEIEALLDKKTGEAGVLQSEILELSATFADRYASLRDIQWINDEFSVLNSLVSEMGAVVNARTPERLLSYDEFDYMGIHAFDICDNLELYGTTLMTYLPVLRKIEQAQDAARTIGARLNSPSFLDWYVTQLEEFKRENLLKKAQVLVEFDQLDGSDKTFCRDIPARTAFLQKFCEAIEYAEEQADNLLNADSTRYYSVSEEERDRIKQEIFDTVKQDITPPSPQVSILQWECTLQISPLSPEVTGLFAERLTRKIDSLIEVQRLKIELEGTRALLGEAHGMLPDVNMEDLSSRLDGIDTDMRNISSAITALKIFGHDFTEGINALEGSLSGKTWAIKNTRADFYSRWLGRLRGDIDALMKMTDLWVDNRMADFIPAGKKAQLKTELRKLSGMVNARPPSADNMDRMIRSIHRRMKTVGTLLGTLHEKYRRKFFGYKQFRIKNKVAGAAAAWLDNRMTLEESRSLVPGRDLEYVTVPILDEAGMIHDIEVLIFRNDPGTAKTALSLACNDNGECSFANVCYDMEAAGHGRRIYREHYCQRYMMGLTDRTDRDMFQQELSRDPQIRQMIREEKELLDTSRHLLDWEDSIGVLADQYNKLVMDPDRREEDDDDPPLFPEYTFRLLMDGFSHYSEFFKLGRDAAPQNSPVSLPEVFKQLIESGRLTGGAEEDPAITHQIELLRSKIRAVQAGRPDAELGDVERAQKEKYLTAIRRLKLWEARYCSPEAGGNICFFYAALLKSLGKVTGENYDADATMPRVPQTMLELPGGEATRINFFSLYPDDPEYRSLYFDPDSFTFTSFLPEAGGLSEELRTALDESLEIFIDYLANGKKFEESIFLQEEFEFVDPDHGPLDGRWYLLLDKLAQKLPHGGSEGQIMIAVKKGLPTNSMVCGNTIMLKKEFVEFILRHHRGSDAAALVLAERIMHELGHIAFRNEGLDRVEEEVRQIELDVRFHEKIFRFDPDLAKEMEEFTSMWVDTPKGKKRFSEAFNTARLFRKIQSWSRDIYFYRDKVRESIRIYVLETLDKLHTVPRNARLFPALPDAEEGDPFSLGYRLARRSLSRLKDNDTALLNDLQTKDAAFLAKKRRIVISTGLIPECQKTLIREINERSREAFENGWTNDLVEIQALSYIQNQRSDDSTDVIVLLEQTESELYRGSEARLIFERRGNSPVFINGLVAAGRAVLYNRMDILRDVLLNLSGDSTIQLPDAAELARCLEQDRDKFARVLKITLPGITIASKELDELNRNILHLLQFA